MNAFGRAAPDAPGARARARGAEAVPNVRAYEDLGNALHRLARALDELLLVEGAPPRQALRALRLVSTDTLHALEASADEARSRRWGGSIEAGLRAMGDEFAEVTGVLVHVRVRGSVELLSEAASAALRDMAAEAFWNVNRHARAGVLLLSLDVGDGSATLDIVDDGVDVARRQVAAWGSSVDLGLHRMRQAVEGVGGRLVVRPLRPRGLRLRGTVSTVSTAARGAR